LSLYARGMTVREIQGHLAELYATDVSPDLISRVLDAHIAGDQIIIDPSPAPSSRRMRPK